MSEFLAKEIIYGLIDGVLTYKYHEQEQVLRISVYVNEGIDVKIEEIEMIPKEYNEFKIMELILLERKLRKTF